MHFILPEIYFPKVGKSQKKYAEYKCDKIHYANIPFVKEYKFQILSISFNSSIQVTFLNF